jgi:YCII-related domain
MTGASRQKSPGAVSDRGVAVRGEGGGWPQEPPGRSSGTPLFTDGPFVESKEHLGGFAVVDVADEEEARLWAGKIAVACGWPQEVRRFRVPMQLPETS